MAGTQKRAAVEPFAWLDGSQVYARFVYGLHANVPEYMVTVEGTFRFLTDHLGSPRLMVNTSTGAVAQCIDYDEWGQVVIGWAKEYQRSGISDDDAAALMDLGTQAGLKCRRDAGHPRSPYWSGPHIHIGPVDHIPITGGP